MRKFIWGIIAIGIIGSILVCSYDEGYQITLPDTIHPMPSDEFITSPQTFVKKLSFSHITEIMTQKDSLARFFFYETKCIKGTWSVKELRRQIATNPYFRSGVSKDPFRKPCGRVKSWLNQKNIVSLHQIIERMKI